MSRKLTRCGTPFQRRRLPPLDTVRAFEAAGRHGSFKDAAVGLGVTHRAVSRRISLLEDWLGSPASQRLNRQVVLTPSGAALLAEFSPALDRVRLPCNSTGHGSASQPGWCCASTLSRPSACVGWCRA
jgi:DNA-binding transcriptional LysR family regulator